MTNQNSLVSVTKKNTKKVAKLNHARTVSMVKKLDAHSIKIDFKKTLIDIKKYSDKIDFNNVVDKNKESFNIEQIERAKKVLTKILKNKNNEFEFFKIACKECKSKKGYFNQYRILCKLNAILKLNDKNESLNLTECIRLYIENNK